MMYTLTIVNFATCVYVNIVVCISARRQTGVTSVSRLFIDKLMIHH